MELYGVLQNPLFLERIPRFPMTTDQKVKGSSPFGCTKKSLNMMNIRAFFLKTRTEIFNVQFESGDQQVYGQYGDNYKRKG